MDQLMVWIMNLLAINTKFTYSEWSAWLCEKNVSFAAWANVNDTHIASVPSSYTFNDFVSFPVWQSQGIMYRRGKAEERNVFTRQKDVVFRIRSYSVLVLDETLYPLTGALINLYNVSKS